MKHIIFCITAFLAFSQLAQAGPVSQERARAIAAEHLRTVSSRHNAPGHAPALTLALSAKATDMAEAADYYVFNTGMDGYVVVAGDDLAPAVLGYSDEGTFNPADVPDGLQYMLDTYRQEIQFMRSQPQAAKAAPRRTSGQVITPMLTTNWNQNNPYNNLCPTYNSSNGTTTSVTGCVATATAQIMYYHRWPVKGTGSHSYSCNVNNAGTTKTLSADFGNTTYEWDMMLNDYAHGYTDAQANAVATLMYHVGVGGEMKYGATSGMSIYSTKEALRNYFGYDKGMSYMKRAKMGITDWIAAIDNELANRRPILYSGYTPNGGHAFVFDGRDANGYYHINWGWGGKSNGYFLVTALNPTSQGIGSYEGGYNSGQEMIVGIMPDQGGTAPEKSVELTVETFAPGVSQVNLGNPAPMILDRLTLAGNGYYPKLNVYMALWLTEENGNDAEQYNASNIRYFSLQVGSTYRFRELDTSSRQCISYTPSTSLADGNYHLLFMYAIPTAGVSNYVVYDHSPLTSGYINVRVAGGVMYFDTDTSLTGHLTASNLTVPTTVGTGNTVELSAVVHNDGEEYYDILNYAVVQNGRQISLEQGSRIDVATNGEVLIKGSFTAPATPGDYQLMIVDAGNNAIGGPVNFKVMESTGYDLVIQSQLKVDNYLMPQGKVSAKAVIANNGQGDYVGPIPYMIINDEATLVLTHANSPIVHIPAGRAVNVQILSPFEGTPGFVYRMCLRNLNYPNSYTIWGDRVPFELMPFSIKGDVNGDGEVSIADVTMLVNLLMSESSNPRSDVNGDGETSIADVTTLVGLLVE